MLPIFCTGNAVDGLAKLFGSPILQGIPLVTGCLLLSQFPYLGFPGDLFVQTANNPDEVPTFSGFGTSSQFYYVEGMGAGA